MKKRIWALLTALILLICIIPTNAYAAEAKQPYSSWAYGDLLIGDTYGIYPLSWYEKDMTTPITEGQFRILISGMREKLLDTNCVTKVPDFAYKISAPLTVKNVLTSLYNNLSSYEFSKDLGFKNNNMISFMKKNKIYKGTKPEQLLNDKCSKEQACIFATRLITYIFDKLDAGSTGFLWETKAGGNTVYMLGSIHFATNDIYPFSGKILEAYNKSDALVVEANTLNPEDVLKFTQYGVYQDGTTLKDHVSADTYQEAVKLGALIGYDENIVSMIKPWYLFNMFNSLNLTDSTETADASQAAALGIDMSFILNAMNYDKPLLEIEGLAYQGQVFDSFSDELEEYLLNGIIDSVNEILEGKASEETVNLDIMLKLWSEGDVEGYKALFSGEETQVNLDVDAEVVKLLEEYYDILFTQRDKKMADYIDALLKSEGSHTYFVIVGSNHYISDYSVLDILEEKGYTMTQIK